MPTGRIRSRISGSDGAFRKMLTMPVTELDRKLKYLKKKSTPSDAASVSTRSHFSLLPLTVFPSPVLCFSCSFSMSIELKYDTAVVNRMRKTSLGFHDM